MPKPILPSAPLFHFSDRVDDSISIDGLDGAKQDVGSSTGSRVSYKSSGACVHCKSLKVRCEFNPGENACQRCQAGNYQCVPRNRKKRKAAPTHEDLQEKAHSQDRQIETLLLQFDKLKATQTIKKWMAATPPDITAENGSSESVTKTRIRNVEGFKWCHKEDTAELAALSYFPPGRGLNFSPPDIVKYCSLYPSVIFDLFSIFFERVNPFFSILDPDLHTPAKLIWTSPFLFTVICAVASRFYTKRPNLYDLAQNFARDAAGRALIDGSKSVDVCQAYLLIAVYPVPQKKWSEDRSWLLMGVAIRMAIELELNLPPPKTCSERESLNRTRTWLNCYCVDGSHAIQYGKMPMLRLDDYLARHSRHWYRSSPMNTPFDIHLCAYVRILLLMAEWRSLLFINTNDQGLSDDFDIVSAAMQTQEKLSTELGEWVEVYAEALSLMPLPICAYRGNTTQMITAYLRLVVLSVAFQQSVKKGISKDSEILVKSIDTAQTVIQIMVERLYPTGNLRYAMAASFLYVAFAAAYLINLLRPKFVSLLDGCRKQGIILTVNRLIEVLGSKDVALDGRHTPALYSRFLSSLLEKHTAEIQGLEHIVPQYQCSWPDILHPDAPYDRILSVDSRDERAHQGDVDVDMDFSLTHFVRTVSRVDPSTINTETRGSWDPRRDETSNWLPTSLPQTSFPEMWNQ